MKVTDQIRVLDLDGNCVALFNANNFVDDTGKPLDIQHVLRSYDAVKARIVTRKGETRETIFRI